MTTTYYTAGTAVTFGPAADANDVTWEYDALADGNGRASASSDLGATIPMFITGRIRIEAASAPTAGEACRLYVAFSDDNSGWPAALTSSDEALNDADEYGQLELVKVCPFDADANSHYFQLPLIEVKGRYVQFILYNDLGVAISSTTTDAVLTMVPMEPTTA